MYLVVAEVLEKSVGDLRQTEALLAVNHQTDDGDASQQHGAHMVLWAAHRLKRSLQSCEHRDVTICR